MSQVGGQELGSNDTAALACLQLSKPLRDIAGSLAQARHNDIPLEKPNPRVTKAASLRSFRSLLLCSWFSSWPLSCCFRLPAQVFGPWLRTLQQLQHLSRICTEHPRLLLCFAEHKRTG